MATCLKKGSKHIFCNGFTCHIPYLKYLNFQYHNQVFNRQRINGRDKFTIILNVDIIYMYRIKERETNICPYVL